MSFNDIWEDTQSMLLETEKILMESRILCNKQTATPSSIHVTLPSQQVSSGSLTKLLHAVKTQDNNTKIKPLNIQKLNDTEASQILAMCKTKTYAMRPCKNVSRGCPVKTYFTIIGLHENFCPLNITIKMKSEGKMNLLMSTSTKFRPFCKSFVQEYDVYFLFKKKH